MTSVVLALGLVASSAGVAAADGWIDCNGPDKNGRGCQTSSTVDAGVALALVAGIAFHLGRKRRGGQRP